MRWTFRLIEQLVLNITRRKQHSRVTIVQHLPSLFGYTSIPETVPTKHTPITNTNTTVHPVPDLVILVSARWWQFLGPRRTTCKSPVSSPEHFHSRLLCCSMFQAPTRVTCSRVLFTNQTARAWHDSFQWHLDGLTNHAMPKWHLLKLI